MDNKVPKKWKYLAVLAVLLLLTWSVVSFFWLGPSTFMKNREAGKEIQDSTYNGDNAIDNYEWFKRQKHDIDAKRKQANNTKRMLEQMRSDHEGPPGEWPENSRERYYDLQNQLLGQQNMHNEMVAEYNARSEMQNRNVFKDQLPYHMEEKFWVADAL